MNIKDTGSATKNYTKEELQRKKLAEESIWVGNDQLKIPPVWLRDKAAVNEWERLVKEFMKAEIISNLDYNNLGFYCNTYSKCIELEEKINKTGLFLGRNPSPFMQTHLKMSEDLRKWANTLGLTVQSRMVAGKKGQSDTEKGLGDDFGDI